jgi:hypothetical protein
MLTEAAAARDRAEVLSIRERLGIEYCPFCEQDTMPAPSGMCLFCSNYIVFKEEVAEGDRLWLDAQRDAAGHEPSPSATSSATNRERPAENGCTDAPELPKDAA